MTDYTKLPPGWDCKYDQSTGNCYYINYFTKAMTLEDPRMRYKQLQNERCSTESIPMQPMHGSPYHVYPSNNFPAVRAFQGPANSSSASPLLPMKNQMEAAALALQRTSTPPVSRMVPNMSRRSTIQETSFSSNQIDTDAVVTKIQNMFPTASDNHIRLLLKKYYNREAVVISALQVEKHPVTMPGPYVTPPAQRHLFLNNSSAMYMTPPTRRLDITTARLGMSLGVAGGVCAANTSRTGSPLPGGGSSVVVGGRFGSVMSMHSNGLSSSGNVQLLHGSPRFGEQIRSSPKPHSSPKMKLRYMKMIFPKADETLLLDILANADNNVQKASEKLLAMGYVKRDVAAAPKTNNRQNNGEQTKKPDDEKIIPLHPKEYTPEEKEKIKLRLKERYKNIAERIISMALESVNFSEDRATQILQIVQDEDETHAKRSSEMGQMSLIGEESSSELTDGVNKNLMINTCERDGDAMGKTTSIQITETAGNNIDSHDQIPFISTMTIRPSSSSTLSPSSLPPPAPILLSSSSSSSAPLAPSNERNESSSSSFKQITTKSILQRGFSHETPSMPSIHGLISNNNLLSRSRDKFGSLKNSPRGSTEEEPDVLNRSQFKSILGRITAMGHNAENAQGPDDSLLLADYVTWNGANPDISVGHKQQIATGADPSNISAERAYIAHGRNPDLCKGAKVGLAKGSIYSQLKANIKCN